jgi:hypothetical protein
LSVSSGDTTSTVRTGLTSCQRTCNREFERKPLVGGDVRFRIGHVLPPGNEDAALAVDDVKDLGVNIRIQQELAKDPMLHAPPGQIGKGRHVKFPVNKFVLAAFLVVPRIELLQAHRPAAVRRTYLHDGRHLLLRLVCSRSCQHP